MEHLHFGLFSCCRAVLLTAPFHIWQFSKIFYPTDVEIVREMWQHGHFDHYPPGYDPTDPNRPKVTKAGQHGEKIIEGIALSDNLGGSNYSRDSVVTEEIPMTFMHGEDGSPSGYQKQENLDDFTQGNTRSSSIAPISAGPNVRKRPINQRQVILGPHKRTDDRH